MAEAQKFEIGLVMAGAVSAGAYTAGVLDFLFQALDEWEKAKAAGRRDVPDHAVAITAMAGASAGGIATALAPLMAFTWPGPLDLAGIAYGAAPPAHAARHLLYRAWVSAIDITRLLETRDLAGPKPTLRALLDGTCLREIADEAVADAVAAIGGGARSRFPWLKNPLQAFLTVANLRGVPYLLPMQADARRGHRMINHADYAHFAILGAGPGAAGALPAGATALNEGGRGEKFALLADAALATSAFPVGLPARRFANPLDLYRARRWPVPGGPEGVTLAPDLTTAAPDPYGFACLDGGALYNEPVAFAARALAGDGALEHDGRKANRALLMIDPFPEESGQIDPGDEGDPDMIQSALGLLRIWTNQARFRPDDVAAALDERDFSRFLIAPVRPEAGPGESAMASAGLAGFAGFLAEDFRRHDFQLGRRNAQKFLRDHLAIPVANPLVAPWAAKHGGAAGALADFHPKMFRNGVFEPRRDMIQLIPLVGAAQAPVQPLPWPRQAKAAFSTRLDGPLKTRARAVADSLATMMLGAKELDPERGTIDLARPLLVRGIAAWMAGLAERAILGDLAARRLLG